MSDPVTPMLHLVLGGARSGKSRHAEAVVLGLGLRPVYVATATVGDAEMAARIASHRARRGAGWLVVEEPLELAAALPRVALAGRAVLVDCLTLWLTNLMLAGRDLEAEGDALCAALKACAAPVVLVSNEVGSGVVPINAMARAFVDAAGFLHQKLARQADRVELVVAGLPLILKGQAPCIS